MDIICGIYMIKNKINNKIYIGQASDIYHRWDEHVRALRGQYHHNQHLQRAWNKYGETNFEFNIVEECDEYELNAREMYWIAVYNSYSNGYNQTEGGDGIRGFTHTDETKQKISSAAKERLSVAANHPMYGKKHSEESRTKMSAAQIKRFENPEQRAKISKSRSGVSYSEETCKKHSEKAKGMNNPRARAVYCIELDEYFWGATEAHEKYGININSICACCRGRRQSAGKHPVTGEKLHWVYADEWKVAA